MARSICSIRAASGCSARSATSLAPRAALAAGCGDVPQSIGEGINRCSRTTLGSVSRQDRTTPSERQRLPLVTSPAMTPRARPRHELLQASALGDPVDELRRGKFIDAEPATFAQSRGAQR